MLFICHLCGLWRFNSLTRDWNWVPCRGSAEFQLMDHQGRLSCHLFYIHLFSIKIVTFASYEIVVQSFSRVWLFATPWTAARQASLSFTISWSLLKFMSTELVLSELSTVTRPSWVALHGMAHSFIELHKPLYHDEAVISYDWFMMSYGRNQHDIVKQLSSN